MNQNIPIFIQENDLENFAKWRPFCLVTNVLRNPWWVVHSETNGVERDLMGFRHHDSLANTRPVHIMFFYILSLIHELFLYVTKYT